MYVRMCGVMTYHLDQIDDIWFIVQSNALDYKKLFEFNDYFFKNWFEFATIFNEMLNCHQEKRQKKSSKDVTINLKTS